MISAILLFLIVAVIVWMARKRPSRSAASVPAEGTERRRLVWMGVVVLIIGLCEMLAPSTVLTGRPKPPDTPPVKPLDEPRWTEATLSYSDVAALAPWLWQLGQVTPAEVRDRLTADVAIIDRQIAALPDLPPLGPQEYDAIRDRESRADVLPLMRIALTDALAQLDDLPVGADGTASGVDVDLFVLDRIRTTISTEAAARKLVYEAAQEAEKKERLAGDGTAATEAGIARSDAAMRELMDKESAYYRLVSSRGDLDDVHTALTSIAAMEPRERPFPNLTTPVVAYEKTVRHPAGNPVHSGPPPGPSLFAGWRGLVGAFIGHRRAPGVLRSDQTCGASVTQTDDGPGLRRVCRVTLPLQIDYDLTGATCTEADLPLDTLADLPRQGTRRAAEGCKESWIYPDLVVEFHEDAFTVHAPAPSAVAGTPGVVQGPLTQWSATWLGRTVPLTPSARFDWDGKTPVLSGLTVRQDLRPGVADVRIWRDFATDRTGLRVRDALTGAARLKAAPFAPLTLTDLRLPIQPEVAAAFMSLGMARDLDALTPSGTTTRLTWSIRARQYALTRAMWTLAGIDPGPVHLPEELPEPALACSADRDRFFFIMSPDYAPAPTDAARAGNTDPCNATRGADALLDALYRSAFAGTWLWMIEP